MQWSKSWFSVCFHYIEWDAFSQKKERKREISIIYLDSNAHCFICSSGHSGTLYLVLPVRHPALGKGLPVGKGHAEPKESEALLVMLCSEQMGRLLAGASWGCGIWESLKLQRAGKWILSLVAGKREQDWMSCETELDSSGISLWIEVIDVTTFSGWCFGGFSV